MKINENLRKATLGDVVTANGVLCIMLMIAAGKNMIVF